MKQWHFSNDLLCVALTGLLAFAGLAAADTAAPTTRTPDPAAAGLTKEGVDKLDALIDSYVSKGLIAGGVAVIERKGKIGYWKNFGKRSLEAGDAMSADTIFRIYSMTKAITSVATMMLFEQGKFALDDPIAKYLPELSDLKVGVEKGDGTLELVPANHQPTIRELLSHTAGFGYGIIPGAAVDKLYMESGVLKNDAPLADKIKALGKLPLKHQPGEQWDYSFAVDVCGRLVEVLSGKTLDEFFQERICGPLGMADTGFYVPKEKQNRFSGIYSLGLDGKLTPPQDDRGRDFLSPPKMLMGGGGLVSTAEDYLRFCEMMLHKGEGKGKLLLKPETVALMTTDVLGDRPISMVGYALGMQGAGFGLGFSVTKEAFKMTRGAKGEYNWGGAASTLFWVDPEEDMIGLYLIQIMPANFTSGMQFKKIAYEALAK